MIPANGSDNPAPGRSRGCGPAIVVAGICAVCVLLKLPVILRQIPAQDEDYFAVPGLTILEEGVPRIPYLPARNDDSAFYRADEMLFALPPLYFYWQAAFYAVFGASAGIARLASAVAGGAAIWGVFVLTRRLLDDARAAVWAAGLYALSRFVYFPCVIARPDMLCGAFGIFCLIGMSRYSEGRRRGDAILAGLCGGLGMLTHPFAIVYCLQAGVWSLWCGASWKQRLVSALLFGLPALAAFSLWGLLIVQEPGLFWTQFSNNVLGKSGPGLFSRMLLPWDSFAAQVPLYIEHAGPIQAGLLTLGTVVACIFAFTGGDARWRTPMVLVLTGIYLHVAFLGTHPTKGYWCYTGALQFLCLGGVLSRGLGLMERISSRSRQRAGRLVLGTVTISLFLPGAGLRTLAAHLEHWSDVNYDAPQFTQRLMDCLPRDKKLVVDPGYIFDFYRGGYDVTLAMSFPFFFDVRGTEYDYVVGGPYSIRDGVPGILGAVPMQSAGDADDLFACRAELYRNPSQPPLDCDLPDGRTEP